MAHFLAKVFALLLLVCQLEAKDLGVYGATVSIEEEDLLSFLQEKLCRYSKEEQQQWMQAICKSITSQLKNTMEVKGISKAHVYSVTYFDPSIYVERDIFNHQHQVVVKKGSVFNPLSQVSLNQELLFFDATDAEQLAWAKAQSFSAKWILTKGQPFQLEETLNRPIYFDQNGVLTKKFGIQKVPTRISQEGLKLKIECCPVREAACLAGA